MAIQTYKVLLELNRKNKSVVDALLNLLPFLVFLPCSFVWCTFSEVALQSHPLTSLLLICSTFTEMVSHMMLQHICDDELYPLHRYSSYLIVLLPIHVYCSRNPVSEIASTVVTTISESTLITVLCGYSVLFTGSRLFMVRYLVMFLFMLLLYSCFCFMYIYIYFDYVLMLCCDSYGLLARILSLSILACPLPPPLSLFPLSIFFLFFLVWFENGSTFLVSS